MQSPAKTIKAWIRGAVPLRERLKHAYSIGFLTWISPMIELSILVFAAMWIGREYLALDAQIIPAGREFLSAIQTHYFWELVRQCGSCALWNASTSGGYPALAEVYGAPLHPLVALTTLRWGVINGAKVGMIALLALAGLAQWWLARVFRLGWLPRMWSALTAIAGGHLAGRMELGVYEIVLSTVMASLLIPAILTVARSRRREFDIVLLGLLMGLFLVAGQGYLQVGMLFMLPALLILVFDTDLHIRQAGRDFMRAGILGVLLAAPLLVPLIHFLPQFGKWLDPGFAALQPLKYLPLNLVIDDPAYYYASEVLGKLPYPNLYTLFIGWPAVILAVVGLATSRQEDRRALIFLATGIGLVFLTASGVFLRWIESIYPSIAGVRFASLIAGLAVPMILGLAAYGLQRLMDLEWPSLQIRHSHWSATSRAVLPLKWLIIIPLLFGLKANFDFAAGWMQTVRQDDRLIDVVESLKLPELGWVDTPFGEHDFITLAVVRGLKLAQGIKPWTWKGKDLPAPVREAVRNGRPEGESAIMVKQIGDVAIIDHPEVHYARVHTAENDTPCTAQGEGGVIHVRCDSDVPGQLIVMEHMWPGWQVWIDGERGSLGPRQWLTTQAPAGVHGYEFRYRPIDVPIGIAFAMVGLLLAVYWALPNRMEAGSSLPLKPAESDGAAGNPVDEGESGSELGEREGE